MIQLDNTLLKAEFDSKDRRLYCTEEPRTRISCAATPYADRPRSADRPAALGPRRRKPFSLHGHACDNRIFLPCEGLGALRSASSLAESKNPLGREAAAVGYSSPVVYDGRVYAVKTAGVLACADAADGTILWQIRLKGPIYATPVLADRHLSSG